MVSFCIKLYTMNFCNMKQLNTSRKRLFTNYLLTPPGLSSSGSLLLRLDVYRPSSVHPAHAQLWRKALLNRHNVSNTLDDRGHFALKHDKSN